MTSTRNSFVQNLLKGVQYRTKKLFQNEYHKAGLTWSKIKYLKHLPYNEPHVYNLKEKKIHYNNGPELLHSLKEIFIEEVYKIDLPQQPYIIDCGANIGLSSIYLKNHHPGARIIAFEPDAGNFSLLQKNIQGNNYTNVELRNEAIWKENTMLKFQSDGTLGSKIDTAATGKTSVVNVKATRLKDLLVQKVDFLKIDIEGAEYEVLKDCGSSLQMATYLFIEYHGYFNKQSELTDIFDLLTANNFSYYIKEASNVYPTPFSRAGQERNYDLQLNIFCFKVTS